MQNKLIRQMSLMEAMDVVVVMILKIVMKQTVEMLTMGEWKY